MKSPVRNWRPSTGRSPVSVDGAVASNDTRVASSGSAANAGTPSGPRTCVAGFFADGVIGAGPMRVFDGSPIGSAKRGTAGKCERAPATEPMFHVSGRLPVLPIVSVSVVDAPAETVFAKLVG